MQYTEAGKHLDAAIVHGYRKVNDDLAGGIAQDAPQAVIEVEFFCCVIEPSSLGFPGIDLLL